MAECPKEVVEAGASLIKARRVAEKLDKVIDKAIEDIGPAVEVMVENHGAKIMQSGDCLAKLREAQRAYGLVMQAHDSLREVLCECEVDQPTDEQVLSIR